MVAGHVGYDTPDHGQVVDRGAHVDPGHVGPTEAGDEPSECLELGDALATRGRRAVGPGADDRFRSPVGKVGACVLQGHDPGQATGLGGGGGQVRIVAPTDAAEARTERGVVDGDHRP